MFAFRDFQDNSITHRQYRSRFLVMLYSSTPPSLNVSVEKVKSITYHNSRDRIVILSYPTPKNKYIGGTTPAAKGDGMSL